MPRCAASGVRAVVDTNVWVSGLIVPDSQPGRVLRAVRDGRIDAVASWALAEEIVEVLRRPKLSRYRISEDDIATVLVLIAPLLPDIDVVVPSRDPDDQPVVAAAVAGRARAIISGDRDLLEHRELRAWLSERGIDVLTPVAAIEWLSAS